MDIMEAPRQAPDHEEVETLMEMVGRVLRLHSAELKLNRSKLTTLEPATHNAGEDLPAAKAIEESWQENSFLKMESRPD